MKSLILIDANSLIHRCFHALPPLTNPKKEPVGAVYGVASVLLKILFQKKPDYVAVLFDRPEPTLRKEKYDLYKAHRPKAPDELVSQIIEAHKLFEAFSIKSFELAGHEADDLIGTFANKFGKEKNILVTILTGDLDSLQLVKDGEVIVETFKKGISETMEYDRGAVIERYGLEPEQLIDYKALVGDQSDNIPGVPGVGQKTAAVILQKYGTLENFFLKGKKEKKYEKILANKKLADLSQDLATINLNVPVEVGLESLKFGPDKRLILEYFNKNGFASLAKRIPLSLNNNTDTKKQLALGEESDKKEEQSTHSTKPKQITEKIDGVLIIDPDDESIPKPSKEDLQSEDLIKLGWDLKNAYKFFPFEGPVFDVSMGYALLGYDIKEKGVISLRIFKSELEGQDFLISSYKWLKNEIEKRGLHKIFYEIEMPLVKILSVMETNGIRLDSKILELTNNELSAEVDKKRKEVVEKIGKDINLNSPKQLLEYFQKDLGLKIKSTGVDVLEKMKLKNPLPIFDDILQYRELFKLKTTYLDAFERLIYRDGKIHPTFLQLGAATGRLSCQNPNLQNIPQESVWSQKIRNIFVPDKKMLLVSFDYSQIELRVIGALTKDENMIDAFVNHKDIHTLTASKIFDVPLEKVDHTMRRVAKTLNFGIMYGMGPRALALNANITQDQAKEFIRKYFEEFSSVKQWQSDVLEKARKTGISNNINGRFRSVLSIHSANQFLASEAERAAINMPSQSLAADILKLAMIKVDKYIQDKKLSDKVRMILTIHDELVFEIDEKMLDKEKNSQILLDIKKIMESAYDLGVPLEVDCKMGERWGMMS